MNSAGSVYGSVDSAGSVYGSKDSDGSVYGSKDSDGSVYGSVDSDGSVYGSVDSDSSDERTSAAQRCGLSPFTCGGAVSSRAVTVALRWAAGGRADNGVVIGGEEIKDRCQRRPRERIKQTRNISVIHASPSVAWRVFNARCITGLGVSRAGI